MVKLTKVFRRDDVIKRHNFWKSLWKRQLSFEKINIIFFLLSSGVFVGCGQSVNDIEVTPLGDQTKSPDIIFNIETNGGSITPPFSVGYQLKYHEVGLTASKTVSTSSSFNMISSVEIE